MNYLEINKKKIINDPVLGFINLQSELVFDLIEHPYFQRLRYIKQLGLSNLVFPGGNHSRFEHAIGTTHLMRQAISVLQNKGHEITEDEAEAVTIAILLHDIGHGPFSHVLENTLVDISHEDVSILLMEELNKQFHGRISLAINIFRNNYKKRFLYQLVSSQLDMDRLDYLIRDSFFTGVTEGLVGNERIIKMLNVFDDNLVVEAKGIYSIEKFLIARRLMYWQVYLHKTVVAAEFMLVNILKRARFLALHSNTIFSTGALHPFLYNQLSVEDFRQNRKLNDKPILEQFASLNDNDILTSIKEWQNHPDKVLSFLSKSLVNRKLFRIHISGKQFPSKKTEKLQSEIQKRFNFSGEEADFCIMKGVLTNSAYNKESEKINILNKEGTIMDIREASDINLSVLTKNVRKYFLCYPKELDIN